MRSGSTLLGEILGAQPKVFNAGEISGLWTSIARGGSCACGAALRECPVWGAALGRLEREIGLLPTDYAGLGRDTTELFRTRHLLRLLRHGRRIPQVQRVVRSTERLLTSAADEVGADVIVDTSKLAPGMVRYHLQSWPTRTVTIFRDPRAVVASAVRTVNSRPGNPEQIPPGETAAKTLFHWYYANGSSSLASYLLRFPVSRVAYEDLIKVPERVVRKLCTELDIVYNPATIVDSKLRLEQSHAAVGNPVRMQIGDRELHMDERWREELAPGQARLILGAATPGLRLLRIGRIR